jgi:hypothetical protein
MHELFVVLILIVSVTFSVYTIYDKSKQYVITGKLD